MGFYQRHPQAERGEGDVSECRYLEEYGVYVTDDGKVLKELKSWGDNRGYLYVSLYDKEEKRNHNQQVHRLVAKAFIPYDENSDGIVMHKDDNPHNNRADNLMWGTYSQNNKDAYDHGLKPKRFNPVLCIETGEVYETYREAGVAIGNNPNYGHKISQVCKSKRASAFGYHWRDATTKEYLEHLIKKEGDSR